MNEIFKISGVWEIKTVKKDTKEVLSKEIVKNLIVNSGLERLAKLLNGESSTYIKAIAIGTGTTAATNSDVELELEDQRELASLEYEADYKAKFSYTFSFAGNTNVTEAGLFDSNVISGSTMFNRVVFVAKECGTEVDLVVTARITVARV